MKHVFPSSSRFLWCDPRQRPFDLGGARPVTSKRLAGPLPSSQMYAIDPDAAEKPVDQYDTLQEFFARRLKPELRPVYEPGCVRLGLRGVKYRYRQRYVRSANANLK